MEDFNQLWGLFTEKLEEVDITLAAIVMRNIWLRSNDVGFIKKFKAPHLVLQPGKKELQEYHSAFDTENREPTASIRETSDNFHQRLSD